MQQKYCLKNNRNHSINNSEDSHLLTNNFIVTKENCMSLSNESDSLLVSSSLRTSSSHGDGSNMKKQKRLNSDFLINESKKTPSFSGSINQHTKITIHDCLPQQNFIDFLRPSSHQQQSCINCSKELPLMKQKIQKTIHRIEEMEALVKICFAKNMALSSVLTEKDNEILQIKTRLEENERVTKKNEQVLVKYSVSKGLQADDVKTTVGKLSEKINQKTRELNEVIELEKSILQQKISKVSTLYDQKFDQLISMVQQLARTQDKFSRFEKESTSKLSNFDFQSCQDPPSISLSKRFYNSNQPKQRPPSSDKARNQSKSKIAYYLSKSNFNDSTTLADTTIHQLSAIGGV